LNGGTAIAVPPFVRLRQKILLNQNVGLRLTAGVIKS